jgi:hypothetical protein
MGDKMTPFTATPAFQGVDCAKNVQAQTSQLVPASLSDSAPWLYSALSQLHDLERVGQNMPGVGDLRLSEGASTTTRTLLSLIEVEVLPSPTLYPISGRGVGMRWNVGRREVEFTTFASGSTVVAKLENNQLVDDTELPQNPVAELNSYLKWLVSAR